MSFTSHRFTLDGSTDLEAHLQKTCDQVLAGVRALIPATKLAGLLLGGGYGRGEGGVLRSPAGDLPYNDLEFYVFVRGNAVLAERQFRHPLHELGEQLTPAAGLEVEFKVLTLDKLRNSAPSMFYYDLVMGHYWQLGDDGLLAGCESHRDAAGIPLHEATRLLMNRCTGLLFSLARLSGDRFTTEDADFVGRNLAKAQLAFGDVLLTANGRYHWSCRERHQRLENDAGLQFPWVSALKTHHAAGVEFKLHPTRSTETRATLAARYQELSALGEKLWLWLESKRLGQNFASARAYSLSPLNKCSETSALRNRLVNLRAFGAPGLACGRYPRERLLQALPLLLWEKNALKDAALRSTIQSNLRTPAADLAGLVAAYTTIWGRFN
jgi:hypothetical protein